MRKILYTSKRYINIKKKKREIFRENLLDKHVS